MSLTAAPNSNEIDVQRTLATLIAAQVILFVGVGAVIPVVAIYGRETLGLSAAASGVVIPRLIGIPKDDELKPWDMPSGKLSFETRLRREVDEPPTYYPMPTSGRRAHSDIVRGLVHNDIVAANDETRLRGEYTPRAGGGVAVAMAGNADGAVAPPTSCVLCRVVPRALCWAKACARGRAVCRTCSPRVRRPAKCRAGQCALTVTVQ